MNPDDELRDAFRVRADRAPDASFVSDRLPAAIVRRRKRNQVGAVLGVTLAVSGLALGVRAVESGESHGGVTAATSSSTTDDPVPTLTTTPASTPPATTTTSRPPTVPNAPTKVPTVIGMGDGSTIKGSDAEPRNEFFNAGYTIDDAFALADAWAMHGGDGVYTAKVVAGQLLLDGHTLPMRPGHQPPAGIASAIHAGTQAFVAHGYGLSDAEQLAQLWNDGAPVDTVKALAGTQLLDGHTLNFG